MSQFHKIVRWFYHATSLGHSSIAASQWRCRCICLWRPGARRSAWRGPEPTAANPLSPPHSFHPRENLAKLVRKEREGRKGGSPIKKCSRKRAAHCHWVHFVSLSSWHRNSSCGEAAAYPQALRCMWHFGCKAVRPPPSRRSNRSRRPS